MRSLKIEPELRRRVQCLREKPSRLGSDAPPAPHQLVDSLKGDTEMLSQRDLGLTERLEELLTENLARVGGDAVFRLHGYPR